MYIITSSSWLNQLDDNKRFIKCWIIEDGKNDSSVFVVALTHSPFFKV
jgi:hypothetical protein